MHEATPEPGAHRHGDTTWSRRRLLRNAAAFGGAVALGPLWSSVPAGASGSGGGAAPGWLTQAALLGAGYAGCDGGLPIVEETVSLPADPAAKSRLPVVPPPPIIRRSEWGADESLRRPDPAYAPVRKIVIHHTDSPNFPADPAASVRSVYRYHVVEREYRDIAYNFLVDHEGRIYEGRWARDYPPGETPSGALADGRGIIGAHAYGYNTGTCGISYIGNTKDAPLPAATLDALVRLVAWKSTANGFVPDGNDSFTTAEGQTSTFPNVVGHKDVNSTDCPGTDLHAKLATIRSKAASMAKGGLAGYWILRSDLGVVAVAGAPSLGSPVDRGVRAEGTAIASTPSGQGYWVLDHAGGVHTFGDAPYHGSLPERGVSARGTGLCGTPSGKGYWLLDGAGGVHSFGDAGYFGSLPERGVVGEGRGICGTPSGKGYWVVDQIGGIHAFGDAGYHGSLPERRVRAQAAGMAVAPGGAGYWVLDRDGGIHGFGPIANWGTMFGVVGPGSARGLLPTPTGSGFIGLGRTGAVYPMGVAPEYGGASMPSGVTAVAIAGSPLF